MSSKSETVKKTSSLLETLNQKVQQLIEEAKSTQNTVSKPLAINGALRINLLVFRDGTVMFSIAKLSQKKVIILTKDDMRYLMTWFSEKYDEVDTLLAVVSKYVPSKSTVSTSEETLF
jgi:hypothetical protein